MHGALVKNVKRFVMMITMEIHDHVRTTVVLIHVMDIHCQMVMVLRTETMIIVQFNILIVHTELQNISSLIVVNHHMYGMEHRVSCL